MGVEVLPTGPRRATAPPSSWVRCSRNRTGSRSGPCRTLEYTPLATVLCSPEFTVAELRWVYESMWGVTLDPRNFHRKMTRAEEFLVPTGQTTTGNGGRPAQLYRRGTARLLMPPMLRPDAA